MKYAFILCLKHDAFASDKTRLLASLCSQASPLHFYERTSSFGTSDDGSIFYYFSTNEEPQLSHLTVSDDDGFKNILNFYYGDAAPVATTIIKPSSTMHRQINTMNGRFSFLSLDLKRNEFSAATTLTRVDPLYKFENSDVISVGSWAYFIHEILARLGIHSGSDCDLYSFMNAGFFGNDDTFFPGVKAITAYATYHVSDRRSNEYSEFSNLLLGKSEGHGGNWSGQDYYESITEQFIKSFTPFAGQTSFEVQLVGGKDSRLVLAGMAASGVDAIANTTDGGAHNFTDVYCAKLVTSALNVRHRITLAAKRPAEATISACDFNTRTINTLKATDFGLISLGNLAFNRNFREYRVFNGLGGELLRGGYAKGLAKQKAKHTPHSLLISKWGRFRSFFSPEASQHYESYVSQWLESNNLSDNLPLAADAAYLYCRMGRWAAALTRSGSMQRRPTYPLLDNAFMLSTYLAPVDLRTNDRLLYEILRRVNKELVTLPLANDYWAFWNSQQVEEHKTRWPQAFRPRGAPESGATLDWRANWLHVIGEHLFDFILSHSNSTVFDIVDRGSIDSLRKHGANNGHRFLLFGIYSALIATSPQYSTGVYSTDSFTLRDVLFTNTPRRRLSPDASMT